MNSNTINAAKGPLVLIVDDSVELREGWSLLLENCGFRVITASNGRDGLDKARQSRPDLIVTDLLMPEMHGLMLCRMLKNDPALKAIPVILCTGSMVTIDEPVFERFLRKPLLIEQLVQEIHALLPGDATKAYGKGVM